MRIIGASVKFSRQLDGGRGSRKTPGFYSERETHVPLVEGESLGDCVQRAFVEVKAQVCSDLSVPPHSELK